MDWKFEVGQRVRKTGGYPFPGIVEARFLATQANGTQVDRYVVNQTAWPWRSKRAMPTGLLHIFAPAQLALEDFAEEDEPVSADLIVGTNTIPTDEERASWEGQNDG